MKANETALFAQPVFYCPREGDGWEVREGDGRVQQSLSCDSLCGGVKQSLSCDSLRGGVKQSLSCDSLGFTGAQGLEKTEFTVRYTCSQVWRKTLYSTSLFILYTRSKALTWLWRFGALSSLEYTTLNTASLQLAEPLLTPSRVDHRITTPQVILEKEPPTCPSTLPLSTSCCLNWAIYYIYNIYVTGSKLSHGMTAIEPQQLDQALITE